MAQEHNGEYYTHWMHSESGKSMVRRLHRIEMQGPDGQVHTITGQQLPVAMVTWAGHGHVGQHVAQILLRHQTPAMVKALQRLSWRDAAYFAIGAWASMAIELIADAAGWLQ